MAGILAVALITVSFLIPNSINKYQSALPHEVVLENMEGRESRPSMNAMPIQQIAQRASFSVVGLAKASARYSRRS
jgi:hypothetical protein